MPSVILIFILYNIRKGWKETSLQPITHNLLKFKTQVKTFSTKVILAPNFLTC